MSSAAYVMGHNDRERRRLALQAGILKPFTQDHLRRAGLARGMHVLELGCGVGDVTLLAAGRVGPEGHVTALDIDDAALATAGAKLREQGYGNATFVNARIDEYHPARPVDAVIGRHILIHCPDPLATLRHAHDLLREGGIVAFQEFDFSSFPRSYPPTPIRESATAFYIEFFGRAIHGDMGGRMWKLLGEAGFEGVECRGEFGVCGGPDSLYYEWFAESMRSILPRANALGIGLEFADGIDTMADRLREEALAAGSSFPSPIMFSATARKRSATS
jgi:ubiquinone/menaquinone biosynthesis C-methylase UbiE